MRVSFWWAALLVGCADGGPLLGLAPDLPPETTLLAALFLDEAGVIVGGTGLVSPAEARRLTLPAAADAATELVVLGWDDAALHPSRRPAVELMASAPLREARPEEPRLPRPSYAARGALDAGPLTSGAAAPELTASWALPCARTACDRFRLVAPRFVSVPGERDDLLRSLVFLSTERGVFMANNQPNTRLYWYQPPDAVAVFEQTIPGARLEQLRRLADGRVALLQSNGQLWVGSPETGFELEVAESLEHTAYGMAVSRYGDPLEVYVQDARSNVYAKEGDRWQRVHTVDAPEHDKQELAWLGPGELVSNARGYERLTHLKDGVVVAERPVSLVRAFTHVEGYGLVFAAGELLVGVDPPGVYVYRTGTFESLPVAHGNRRPEEIWPTFQAREFMFGGANGDLFFYADGLGTCTLPHFSGDSLRSAVWLEHGVLIAPRRPDAREGDTQFIYAAFAAPPTPDCERAYQP